MPTLAMDETRTHDTGAICDSHTDRYLLEEDLALELLTNTESKQ